jgi:predicted kinase
LDSKIVTREIKQFIWPLLKQAGFGVFSSRSAWRHRSDGIDVVCFQSFTRDIADSLRITTHSFSVRLGWFPNYIPPTYPPKVKNGKILPEEYGCEFRGSLKRTLPQAQHVPNDIWYVDQLGENLAECIGDVARLIPRTLELFDVYADKKSVLEILLEQKEPVGLGPTCNNSSPKLSYLTGYVASCLGDHELARKKLQEAVDSQCYINLFSSVDGALNRAMDSAGKPALLSRTWHILAGATGAGKSTVARELVERTGGVRFAVDEWMERLYWMDCPEKNDYPWAIERVRRCEAQIAAVAAELARAGVDAVLDLGFTTREQRLGWLERGRAAGVRVELHVLDVPAEVRWERVCGRNEGASATFTFAVTREMFEAMERLWELPGAEELAAFAAGDADPLRG